MPRRTVKPYKLEVEFERTPLKLGEERRLLKLAVQRSRGTLEEWRQAGNDDERFYALPRAAVAAFNLGEFSLARDLANQTLEFVQAYRQNWNFGNAIHYAHTTLGLLALRDGDLPAAARELELSSQTIGSPQLKSFGPTMQLAKALLKAGASQPVLSYLHSCKTFWSSGSEWITVWERKIRRGEIPNFIMHNYL